MAKHPRGIAPELLFTQVRGTMPYLFSESLAQEHPELEQFPPARLWRGFIPANKEEKATELSHSDYFRLCLSAHYLTCGTPVPTDVDNQIRLKLWPAKLSLETAIEMAEFVLQSRHWNFSTVSTRYTTGAPGSALENEKLSGHLGEWFTVSCAAYCAMRKSKVPEAVGMAEKLFTAIESEIARHSEIFGSLWRAKDGARSLKAAANIAHNFGDLDRVMDMWELPIGDPLRLRFYKLTALPFDGDKNLRYQGRLWVAGELYKSKLPLGSLGSGSLALENHRHFALRKPRSLREKPEFVLPTAPFFDDWGFAVAKGLSEADGQPSAELLDVFDTLAEAWIRQPGTFAYGRGLRSFMVTHPELEKRWSHSPGAASLSPLHSQVLALPKEAFEALWGEAALAEMDDIPSRA
ncbi:MAG: hypothetical protein H7301_14810 [Cryobacterium sp.]|nr:hypothetical protein [Oligoflexia bacterium]